MSRTFFYFAYCTNMLSNRMECCVGKNVRRVRSAKLEDYKLMFGQFSPIYYGTLPTIVKECDCQVWGSLWEVPECLKPKLDELMGVPSKIYKPLTVMMQSEKSRGGLFEAYTYQLNETPAKPDTINGLWKMKFRPSKIYHDDLIEGAEEACLPVYYRRWIRQIPNNGYTGSVKPDLEDNSEL
ncbi:gamma-glutamylcyclotransferase-like [Cimex lectularius]|uniref:gamma-glutamylcyclotransferase n=1 Tax=Cimex lectularius TaxID=79782 RepID=A0A8I6R9M9_CIMLE|nr:gamma-glutamylcyclotransferase-like [Cimex lectularius]